jgi:hypothetical protein
VLGAAVIAGLLLQTALPATVLAGTTPGNTDHLAAVVSGTPTAGTALRTAAIGPSEITSAFTA